MHKVSLAFDEVDDLLYFTRANEVQELQQAISELAQKNECQPRDVLEACIDPETGNSVLHYCSANGLADLLQTLLSQLNSGEPNRATDGKVVGSLLFNHQNKEGNTPLHWAAYNGQLEVVKLLVAAGANMWIKNAAGQLAMYEAMRAEKNDVLQYLVEAKGKEAERTGGASLPSGEEFAAEAQNGEGSSSNGGGGAAAAAEQVADVEMGEPGSSG